MGPIDPHAPLPKEAYFILFLGLVRNEKWMPPSPNWDGLPVGRHFQNGHHQNLWNYIFASNSVYRRDRDKILVSKPMLVWMRNPMITLINPYDSWLTRNSKWLPSQPAKITLISQWAQYWQYTPHAPARNVKCTKAMLFCHGDLSQHEKPMPPSLKWDGLSSYIAPFSKRSPASKITFSFITPHLG